MSTTYHQTEIRTTRKQREWSPRAFIAQAQDRPIRGEKRERPVSATALILFFGVAGELIIPWLVIWLSDAFVFDVPAWLTWLSFAGPLAIGLLAILVYWTIRASRVAPAHALSHAHQGRR
jgi:apolipoprotein N-acyltransferase